MEQGAGGCETEGKAMVLGSDRDGLDTSRAESSIYPAFAGKARLSHSVALIQPVATQAIHNRATEKAPRVGYVVLWDPSRIDERTTRSAHRTASNLA